MKKTAQFLLAASVWLPPVLSANTAPTVLIQSAQMRPGTTFLDVVYRVNDPDDATVKTRALAFIDGVRSFAKVIKPTGFVEGSAAQLGDAIATNTDHTLTWNVAADWNVELGQLKFEVLARDSRGLLPIDWITIPAAAGQPALTISKDAPSDASVLDALFWQYAAGDDGVTLENGELKGSPSNGNLAGLSLATGSTVQYYATPFVLKRMNLDPATAGEVDYAVAARAGLSAVPAWHVADRAYAGVSVVLGWGENTSGQTTIPRNLTDIIAISAGHQHSLALRSDGTVVAWGDNTYGQATVPAGLNGVTAIACGGYHNLALKNNGTVVAWGKNDAGQSTVPAMLFGVTSIAAGENHSGALMRDIPITWGSNSRGQTNVLYGDYFFERGLGLWAGGDSTSWYSANYYNRGMVMGNLSMMLYSEYTTILNMAIGYSHIIVLNFDGTLRGYGDNTYGQLNFPLWRTGVVGVAAGNDFSLFLFNDGSVLGYGVNSSGQTASPANLRDVTSIAAGYAHGLALKPKRI